MLVESNIGARGPTRQSHAWTGVSPRTEPIAVPHAPMHRTVLVHPEARRTLTSLDSRRHRSCSKPHANCISVRNPAHAGILLQRCLRIRYGFMSTLMQACFNALPPSSGRRPFRDVQKPLGQPYSFLFVHLLGTPRRDDAVRAPRNFVTTAFLGDYEALL